MIHTFDPVFVEQDRATKLIEELRAAERVVPDAWTDEFVGLRLIEAFETLGKMPNAKTLPQAFGNGWPAIVRDFTDAVGAEDTRERKEFVFERAKARASADEITRMDEALAWPLRYMRGMPSLSKPLLVWCVCKAYDWSISRQIARRGLPRATFDRRRTAALKVIRRGLVMDEIALQ